MNDIIDNDLNYMRTEVQKIINNHAKEGEDGRFSVMNYDFYQLDLLINLLKGNITIEELEKKHNDSEKELKKTYELIICEYDYFNDIKNRYNDGKATLGGLKEDITLDSKLDELDNL